MHYSPPREYDCADCRSTETCCPEGNRYERLVADRRRHPGEAAKDVLTRLLGPDRDRHLAFGSGAHLCIGVNLARLEGKVAIGRFISRFPDYRPSGTPVRGGRARFRGFSTIPVEVR
jgi:cytochrome P450